MSEEQKEVTIKYTADTKALKIGIDESIGLMEKLSNTMKELGITINVEYKNNRPQENDTEYYWVDCGNELRGKKILSFNLSETDYFVMALTDNDYLKPFPIIVETSKLHRLYP